MSSYNYLTEELTAKSISELRAICLDLNIKPLDARKKSSFIDAIQEHQTNLIDAVEYVVNDLADCVNTECDVYAVVTVDGTDIGIEHGCIDYYRGGCDTALEVTFNSFDYDSVEAVIIEAIECIKNTQEQIEIDSVSDLYDEDSDRDITINDVVLTACNTQELYLQRHDKTAIASLDSWIRIYSGGLTVADRIECIKQITEYWEQK